MHKYTISIIVAVYNTEHYLRRCLDSIISQTYRKLQIVIIDDGSTDGSQIICDYYKSIDDRVEVYHNCNHGLVYSRKFGLKKAIGEYVAFVDSDDYIDPNMYESLLNEITNEDCDFIHSNFWEHIGDKDFASNSLHPQIVIVNKESDRINALRKYFFSPTKEDAITYSIWSKMFKSDVIKECYEEVSNCSNGYGEDAVCFFLLLLKSRKFKILNNCFYHYEIRECSMSHLHRQRVTENEMRLVSQFVEVYDNNCELIEAKDFWSFITFRLKHTIEMLSSNNIYIPRYYMEETASLINKRVVLYGAGNVGNDLYIFFKLKTKINIVAVVDKKGAESNFRWEKVNSPEEIKFIDYDIILIAVRDRQTAMIIRDELIVKGIEDKKILWANPAE